MKVSIVIPNWNGVHLLGKNLPRVLAVSQGAEIIVSDDNSSDGSRTFLKKHFPAVRVVARKVRGGFSSNVNSGVAKANGDIVVLLNTDVVPEEGFLTPLLAHFRDPDVFAVGCLEKSAENGKTILRGRGLAHWYRGFYTHKRGETDRTNTAWIAGGSGAFRKSMWDDLGGMDTIYNPFYWEDIDLSYRARKAGWKLVFEPKSVVHHFHEEGKIKKEFSSLHVTRINYRNQFLFVWKNVTDVSILLSHAFWTPIRLIQTLLRGNVLMVTGYLSALVRLPAVFKRRQKQKTLYQVGDHALNVW